MVYDYKAGKKRVKEILDNKLEVIEKDKIPKDNEFTYTNAYYGWVGAIFIDIRDSSNIFSKEDKEVVSKMIRSFTSEIIEILRGEDNEREIGIRGDCVYCIYTTPSKSDTYSILEKAFWINTYIKMLNKLLKQKGFDEIKAGIGVSISQELVIKAGRKDVGIYSQVWIGDAVTRASNLSSLGDKDGNSRICLSSLTYRNIIEQFTKKNGEESKEWFKLKSDVNDSKYYHADIVKSEFSNWIDEGMKD